MRKLAIALVPALLLAFPSPAHAETVSVKSRTSLPASGMAKVKVSGLPKNVGVYVQLCKKPKKGTRPASGTCLSSGQEYGGIWVVGRYPYGPRPKAANLAKPGTWFRLPVQATFGSVDCRTTKCVIFIRRDHRKGADTSYDSAIPVTFK